MVKSWLVQDQTVLGKDYSNLLIADSLLKTVWFINAPCYGNEALASPKENDIMAPKRTSTSAAPSMTQAAIRKLVVDSVVAVTPPKIRTTQRNGSIGVLL
ncbi:hypothetical protein Tco_1275314 [Tanacetum coccineum]